MPQTRFSPTQNTSTEPTSDRLLPEGFAALNDYETLGRYLADAGYPDETIQNLFCNSLMKVVKTCIM